MTQRAVAYGRVSTENQAKHGYSLPSQLEACRKYIDQKGWGIAAEISDSAVSGATLDRAGLDRIREMSQAGEIDVVVVYDLDRLSRKAVHQMLIEEEFGKYYDKGFRAFKMKVGGGGTALDVARVKKAREVIGVDSELMGRGTWEVSGCASLSW